jgi:hypothetical protein
VVESLSILLGFVVVARKSSFVKGFFGRTEWSFFGLLNFYDELKGQSTSDAKILKKWFRGL